MTDASDEQLPPLGEPTPGRARRPGGHTAWYKRPSVVGLAGTCIGLLLGLGVGALMEDDRGQAPVDVEQPVETTAPRRTTTTVAALPPECVAAIRSAEQSLNLLDQVFQTARRFDVVEFDRMLSELQDVRRSLTERVRACVERA
jgi:hypothetical protein